MANRRVTLLRYCKTESGWRRYQVVIGKTGKVKPNAVWVQGHEEVRSHVFRERFVEAGHRFGMLQGIVDVLLHCCDRRREACYQATLIEVPGNLRINPELRSAVPWCERRERIGVAAWVPAASSVMVPMYYPGVVHLHHYGTPIET